MTIREYLSKWHTRSKTPFEAFDVASIRTGCMITQARVVMTDDAGTQGMLEIVQHDLDDAPDWPNGIAFPVNNHHAIQRWISTIGLQQDSRPCGGCHRCLDAEEITTNSELADGSGQEPQEAD